MIYHEAKRRNCKCKEKLNADLLELDNKIKAQQQKLQELKSKKQKIEEQIRSERMDGILKLMDFKNLTVEKLEEIINLTNFH